jgi:hypothetical protein
MNNSRTIDYNLDNIQKKICNNQEDHIWIGIKGRSYGDMYYGPGKGYYCKNCKVEIRSESIIPCKHKWINQQHNLGKNYIKLECDFCEDEKIELN